MAQPGGTASERTPLFFLIIDAIAFWLRNQAIFWLLALPIAGLAALVVLAMVGLAFASVPLYRLFCQVTGIDGTTQRAAEARIRSELREVAPDLAVVIERGDAADAILRTTEACHCGLVVAGVFVPGWGWVLIALVVLILGWILVLAWPRLTGPERLMRSAVVALMVAVTVTQALPRT